MGTRVSIVPFTREHIDAAAELLATRQRQQRHHDPRLPATLADPAIARAVLDREAGLDSGDGAVALRDGHVVGYLIGRRVLPAPTASEFSLIRPRSIDVSRVGWAADETEAYDLCRLLYAWLAERWVREGFFAHYVWNATAAVTGLESWHSLGFGQEVVTCARDITSLPEPSRPVGIEMRLARLDDLDAVMPLFIELDRYHALSPMFVPFLQEPLAGWHEIIQAILSAPEGGRQGFVATRDKRIVGLVQLILPGDMLQQSEGLPTANATYLLIGMTDAAERSAGIGQALVTQALRWARDQGNSSCLTHVFSGNVHGMRFWRRYGFEPIDLRLMRAIDERIAWARP